MSLDWTNEAEAAIARAPLLVRPLIRRRLETAAHKARRQTIDLDFVQRMKSQAGPQATDAEKRELIREDVKFLAGLVSAFCSSTHAGRSRETVPATGAMAAVLDPDGECRLCADCRKLFLHAAAKRVVCPQNPKPSCRHCSAPCHHPEYRARMAQLMAWGVGRPEAGQTEGEKGVVR